MNMFMMPACQDALAAAAAASRDALAGRRGADNRIAEFSIGLLFVNVLPVLMHGRIQVGLGPSIYYSGNKLNDTMH